MRVAGEVKLRRLALLAWCLFGWVAPAQGIETAEQLLARIDKSLTHVNTQQLQALAAKHPDLRVIDVRMGEEIAAFGGMLDLGYRTLNISRGWLEYRAPEALPSAETPVVVYCGSNRRSRLAAHTLMRMGYKNVYNYVDTFFGWRDAGLPIKRLDEAPGTMLFREPVKVADGIWSAIGATAPPTYENSGHNNNLSFIVTQEGVVVINAGDNYLLAQSLHAQIRKRTEQPVRYVILENGQGHAMLGSNYWQQQGAKVIAHKDAAAEIAANGLDILDRMRQRNRDKAMGTEVTQPDIVFEGQHVIELGGQRIEIRNLGPTHSPGDVVVWLPAKKLVIAGDMAFHERLLPVFEHTDTAAWIETWQHFAALDAQIVIPGHGHPTTMAQVTKFTVDYLRYMRTQIAQLIENGGTLVEAYAIDQSAYAHLDTFDELARLNAGRIFRAMEFE